MKKIKLASEQHNIKKASSEIVEYLLGHYPKLDKDTLFDVKLCTEEAVRNAIVHGNKSNKDIDVDISFGIDNNTMKIVIEDHGEGFILSDLPDPTKKENIFKGGGRGVYLIHRLMDDAAYNEKGNVITMIKKIT